MSFEKNILLKNPIHNNKSPFIIEKGTLLENRQIPEIPRKHNSECYDYANMPISWPERIILGLVLTGGATVWVLALHFLGAF